MRSLLFCFMALLLPFVAYANEDKSVQDLMLISKMTGVCGVMQQMASFQSSTKMPGGNEFIERFWLAEFARLGKTQEMFFNECEKSIATYNRFWGLIEKSDE